MASTYTTSARLTKQGVGDNSGTWGTIANTVFDLIDESLDGVLTKSATGSGDITLTTQDGATDEARHRTIVFTGTPSADRNVIVPSVEKLYFINNTTSANSLIIKTAAGTGVTVENGKKAVVYCDGTNVEKIFNSGDTEFSVGMILLWSGTIATIPSGWQLCDGTNSTPDLRDKFVVGARQDDSGVAKTNLTSSLTTSGGAISATTDSQGAHTHTGSTGSYTLTTSDIPSHSHNIGYVSAGLNAGGFQVFVNNTPSGTGATSTTGSGGAHSHTISSDGAHTHDVDTVPPYYALAYIMYVG